MVSHAFSCLFRASQKQKVVTKNKWFDEENVPLVQDKDYDDYKDTSRIDAKTSFTEPATTEAISTFCLRQTLKRDKIVSLYRYLDMAGDPSLADLKQFMIKKNSKTGNIELLFLDGNKHWQSLNNKETGEFLAPNLLREKFGGLAEDIHVKTREASQNTDLHMEEFLGINKALQSIKVDLLSNTSKLLEIDKCIKSDTKKL